MHLADFRGGSIVNVMASIEGAMGGEPGPYAEAAVLPAAGLAGREKIVLLVADGLGLDFLERHGAGGLLHRNLAGALTSVVPPTTATAIPAFLTGRAPLQHGFTGWFTWFREIGGVLAVLPFTPRHGGPPPPEDRVSPHKLSGTNTLFARIRAESHLVMPERIAHSIFNRDFQGPARLWAYETLDELFQELDQALARPGPSYTYAYWPEYDAIAHAKGTHSPEAIQAVADFEQQLGRFAERLAGENIRILITADHGFIDSPPECTIHLEDHPRLAECLVMPLTGEPRLAFCYVHPHKQRQFEDYVQTALADQIELVTRERMLQEGWFGLGPAHPYFDERIGHYALVMRDRYKIKDWILGERPYQHQGVHGGLSREEMIVPLVSLDLKSGYSASP